MSTDRTPDEWDDNDRDRAAIDAVLERAAANLISWILAEALDEPADICEEWVARVWNDLRDGLDQEQRLRAILDLITPAARVRAARMMMSSEATG